LGNAITGWEDSLQPYLADAIQRAESISMIVAFVMESGVKLLTPHLLQAAERDVPIRLLTGKYMGVTEPSAIYYLLDRLEGKIEIRFFNDTVRSFHPKAFIFENKSDGEIFIGSSNISRSALTTGVEWNYRFYRSEHPLDFQSFTETYNQLFYGQSEAATPEAVKAYALSWKKSAFIRTEERAIQVVPQADTVIPEPRGAQIEALYYLKKARDEGVKKGLVAAATGIGKTHLAAFDSLAYRRILFLAHREEIVSQARRIFQELRPGARLGYFTGNEKNIDADILFSTVQTMSKLTSLHHFKPEDFDYIVVDEFHHAAADSYRRVLGHFRPAFLMGLTATPYRMDNRDIFALCDDNVIYEINLRQAIERDLLVPFHYAAVYDPTDYSQVAEANGRYLVDDLEKQLSRRERADLILDHYRQQAGQRSLAFCVSISHAEYMADYFNRNGVQAAAVHSGSDCHSAAYGRREAIEALEDGRIRVIFTVDIFNEGVDIPSVDTVMFLRPTESYVIFLQQLGRGLRQHPGKEFLRVLDFIGNYKRAHYLPLLLAGENPQFNKSSPSGRLDDLQYPEGCLVNFDFRLIDLFREMARRDPLPIRMRDNYLRLKQDLARRPERLDLFEGCDVPMREYLKKGWLSFLESMGELDAEETGWLGTAAEDFLMEIEHTSFTKAYKVPTIGAFLREDSVAPQADLQSIGESVMRYYRDDAVHQKDLHNKSHLHWRRWGLKEFTTLARKNPVHFLSNGRKKFFRYDEINQIMSLDPRLVPYLSPRLAEHLRDILKYRETDYFRRRYKDESED